MKPSKEFTIKILSSEDYDMLPYAKAKESLGMSVMETKTAYIRETGVKELDQHTIEHEFDELMQETSPHEIDGIRYKLLPFLAPLFAPILNFFAGFGSAGAGLAGAAGPATLGSAALSGIGPGLASLAGSAVGAIPGLVGGALVGQGVSNTISSGNPFSTGARQATNLPGFPGQSFSPSQSTQAFAPQTQSPLGRSDFDASLTRLGENKAAQRSSVFDKFRGLGAPAGNTAFSGSLASADASSKLARQNFLEDQRKLGSTFA